MTAKQTKTKDSSLYFLAAARISLGLVFLWAFFDKLFGLGFATCRNVKTDTVTTLCQNAWVHGGSPTLGFLKFATKGPLASFYQGLAGNGLIDALFMSGLLLIGLALVLGIGIRIATVAGTLLVLMMWSAALWPANNPILDEHIIYAFLLLTVGASNSRQVLGLRDWWVQQPVVKRFRVLE